MTFTARLSELLQFQRARYVRIRAMTASEILRKVRERLTGMFGYRSVVRRAAYHLNAYSIGLLADRYVERSELGPQNLAIKMERQRQGGPFEPHSIALINKAATQLLDPGGAILEVGCGTGMFSVVAAEDESRRITASEQDTETLNWAKQNRVRPNIEYCSKLLTSFGIDQFDAVVAIELIEHVSDYAGFLENVSRVAPMAIITTPNKNRSPTDSVANTPTYHGHVREWTAGEFFWVLRAFFSDVEMYTIAEFRSNIERHKADPDFVPCITKCSVLTQSEPLIATCKHPNRRSLIRDG